jgi:uncharacterized repeat protein (TIGR03803 family)
MKNVIGSGISRFFRAALGFAAACLVAAQPAQAQTYTVLHDFTGGLDGGFPHQVIQDSAGNLYGTSTQGGANYGGNIFKLDTFGTLTVLYSFKGGVNGALPQGPLFRDPEGNLYGTAREGGDPDCRCGIFFKLDTNNVLTILHTFTGGPNGSFPFNNLVSVKGELYGATEGGGTGWGVIYKITKTGQYTVLHNLDKEGEGSQGDLTRDSAGNIYSETYFGGSGGTIFELDTAGKFSVLYNFGDGRTDGSGPVGRLLRDAAGTITGAASFSAGNGRCGEVFRLATDGTVTALHHFFGGRGGCNPETGLVDLNGTLYGTTYQGGNASCFFSGCGLIYRISSKGVYSVIHRFAGPEGAGPLDEMTKGSDGSIYGITRYGGTGTLCINNGRIPGCGVIFKYTP